VAQADRPRQLRRLQDLQTRQVILGLPKFSGRKAQICEACQLGKQHRLPFPNERSRTRNKLDLIHSDVWGPAQNVSLGGSRYFLSFIDDCTQHTWVYLIARKSEVFDCFRDLKGFVENKSGRKIKCLRSDGGKEYFSGQFNGYLQQMGIRREFSCRYTPEQNSVAERKNRSIVEAARAARGKEHA
jgi:transposase InsO family protein